MKLLSQTIKYIFLAAELKSKPVKCQETIYTLAFLNTKPLRGAAH